MEYRVSLEERGIKSSEEIDKKVALLRKKHEADLGIVDGQWLPNRDGDVKGSDGSRVSGDYITIYYPWVYTMNLSSFWVLLGCEVDMLCTPLVLGVLVYFISWLKFALSSAMALLAPHICK
jgi:hypothetical protein